jgi:hypothetical protein
MTMSSNSPTDMRENLVGQKFNMLTVRAMLPGYKCLCDCDCGLTGVVKLCHGVKSGGTQSCGCSRSRLISQNRATHGDTRIGNRAPEYGVWRAMLQRCFDPKSPKYPMYGGRGITVCDEWRKDYSAFLSFVGRRPTSNHSIDRFPNLNGNYEPGNVRWATREQQARNTRSNRFLSAFGARATIAEWAELAELNPRLISKRLALGWEAERILSQDVETTEERRLRATAKALASGNRIGVNLYG